MGKIIDNLKYHFVDSTSLNAAANPIYSAFEVGIAGMSDEVSIAARSIATGLTYFAGMGWAFGKGRDIWRRNFKINDNTKEQIQGLHDALYASAFTLLVVPPLYLASGVNDIRQLAIGTGTAVIVGMVHGPLLGYAVSVGRDLTGLEACHRRTFPDFVRKSDSKIKKGLGLTLVAASIGLMAGIYSLTPNADEETVPQQTQEVITLENIITE